MNTYMYLYAYMYVPILSTCTIVGLSYKQCTIIHVCLICLQVEYTVQESYNFISLHVMSMCEANAKSTWLE